jgi:hypothetical protein
MAVITPDKQELNKTTQGIAVFSSILYISGYRGNT